MSISDLYESGTQKKNISHFAAMANIALIDGEINDKEKAILMKFAVRLNISDEQVAKIIKDASGYSVSSINTKDERLEYLFDLFKVIFADHDVDDAEIKLVRRYALGLGCTSSVADEVIAKSIRIFRGDIDFEDYKYLIDKLD